MKLNMTRPMPNWMEKRVVDDYSDFSRKAFWKAYHWQAAVALFRSGVIQNGGAVLDLGSGPGWISFIMKQFCPQAVITGVDISDEMVKASAEFAAEQGLQDISFVQGDAMELPFADNSFDMITSFAVLRLVPEPAKAIQEAYRVLKPGGLMYISDVGQMPVEHRQAFLDGIENPVANDIMQKALASALSPEEIHAALASISDSEKEVATGGSAGFESGSREILDWVREGFPLRELRGVGEGPAWASEISKHWTHIYVRKALS
ncbi:class I SAM-dependent methyltransferase [Tumebacillus sp. DT12]|uniref:Class I SAM-dependent methyltransferase n=1 Tax=Tumebacillus lacus TaxID=2995335 RepID=A0ABT3X3D5_9BACL|nr:class I SAM-dependent methyltransferase [Tumebacillus lacus]MCX7570488.1 class I SAM-dependent methyltransferase [Tumebacillus lacus]